MGSIQKPISVISVQFDPGFVGIQQAYLQSGKSKILIGCSSIAELDKSGKFVGIRKTRVDPADLTGSLDGQGLPIKSMIDQFLRREVFLSPFLLGKKTKYTASELVGTHRIEGPAFRVAVGKWVHISSERFLVNPDQRADEIVEEVLGEMGLVVNGMGLSALAITK